MRAPARFETHEGTEFVLRPAGLARFFVIAFLLVWLAAWAVAEIAALSVLLSGIVELPLPRGFPRLPESPAPTLTFLVLWLALWTLGGVGAIYVLLRTLFGRDRVLLRPGGIALGAAGRRQEIPRTAMRAVEIQSKDGALVLHLAEGKPVTVTSLGTPAERAALLLEIRARYALRTPEAALMDPATEATLPADWESELTPRGEWVARLSRAKRQQTTGCLLTVAALLVAGFGLWGASGRRFDPVLLAVASVAALLALVFAVAREEIAVSSDRLELRRAVGPWSWSRIFVGGALRTRYTTDSDGDEWYRLEVVAQGKAAKLWSGLNDRASPILLARWLASRTGWKIESG